MRTNKLRFRDGGNAPDPSNPPVPVGYRSKGGEVSSSVRLNKYLAAAGLASRRGADKLVFEGHVKVNGSLAESPGLPVRPGKDKVEVDGKPVGHRQAYMYVVVNKPLGVVTTARDPQGRKTILDLVPAEGTRLYPVGRLDYDSEGLLFLMNDGRLAFRLTHPRYEVTKTYRVELDRLFEDLALQQVERGLILDDGPTRPAVVKRVPGTGGRVIDITIHEGRNRQVRRMIEAVGFTVTRLRRIRFAGLELEGLSPGQWRTLRPSEVQALRKLVGLSGQ